MSGCIRGWPAATVSARPSIPDTPLRGALVLASLGAAAIHFAYAPAHLAADTDGLRAHPYADMFPLLAESELAELVESIKANGLLSPTVLTADGLILDGRNRYRSCQIAGVEPEFVTYEGDDLAEYVIDANATRRNQSTGARAMSTALVLAADGRRKNGRWEYGEVRESFSPKDSTATGVAISKAGTVLEHAPDLADAVVSGATSLDAAYDQARERKVTAKRTAEAMGRIRTDAPDLAEQVHAETLTIGRVPGGGWFRCAR
jgi:hypothetical protein